MRVFFSRWGEAGLSRGLLEAGFARLLRVGEARRKGGARCCGQGFRGDRGKGHFPGLMMGCWVHSNTPPRTTFHRRWRKPESHLGLVRAAHGLLTGRNNRLARPGIEPGTYRSAVTFVSVNGAHNLLEHPKAGRCRTLACWYQWGWASAAQGWAQPRLACCTTGSGGGDEPRRPAGGGRGGAARVCGWQGAAGQVSHTCLLRLQYIISRISQVERQHD